MKSAIAIVGMACRYPDARSPWELWENVLAQRRAFRRMPPERLRLEDYLSADRHAPDRTYTGEAALIEGYEFDRIRFRVSGSTFRSADLAHWLALDIAAQALSDAGFPEGEGLPKEMTGVLLGNTLTGEFSRANVMRLRWPYVRRVVEARLSEQGWSAEQRAVFLSGLEEEYKRPFPPVGEETLAGGLSNTIAGRICNHFDLKGGGYTVDGACASSLLAVANACSALAAGDLDVALAGGVDLSLDPFELVGFAKTEALAPEEMRVYDVRSKGFRPGEGCGFVTLMRLEDALAERRRVYAVIRGWGISSDGSGGITRPEVEGQLLAVKRAYRRAGFGPDTVAYFEGHGTGTSVGDATELQVLSLARTDCGFDPNTEHRPAAISSIKAIIGHTKAAAGVAGLLKATMALHTQILPPTTGCEEPHPELTGDTPALRALRTGEPWPADLPLRAGVSAMGFGGINAHVVLEGTAVTRRKALTPHERALLNSAQDAELFLLGAADADGLRRQVEHLRPFAARISRAEMADLAAQLANALAVCRVRAAVVASTPAELASRLETLAGWLDEEVKEYGRGFNSHTPTRPRSFRHESGVYLGAGAPRIGFLFPGQGSPAPLDGGALRLRFECVQELYAQADLPTGGDSVATEVAQPAIVTAEMAALRVLDLLGITAQVAIGHSLGELTALHWAGAYDEAALRRIAMARGRAMAELGSPTGAMASLGAGMEEAARIIADSSRTPVVLAGLNSPRQTVISGESSAVSAVVERAQAKGLRAVRLPVSHAFHSPLVAAAVPALAAHLAREEFRPLTRTVVSTVTGAPLQPGEDLRALLCRQVTSPVRFTDAVSAAMAGSEELPPSVDLWIEAGPGRVLSGLLADCADTPVIAMDACGPSLAGVLNAVGAAFALGAPINHTALFADRFTRPFDLNWQPKFFVNPCELAPISEGEGVQVFGCSDVGDSPEHPVSNHPITQSPLDLVRQLVAERAELPSSAVRDDSRLLSDLHLNSIAVGQLVAEAARRLNLPPPVSPTDYAGATVAGVAQALEELARTGVSAAVIAEDRLLSGVDSWVRTFSVEWVECPLPYRKDAGGRACPERSEGMKDEIRAALHPPDCWRVFAPPGLPLAVSLRRAFAQAGGSGVVVCLPPGAEEDCIGLLLEGAQTVLKARKAARFVLVQHGGGASAFAKTLHLEAPEVAVCVVDVPPDHPQAAEWVAAEASGADGYVEARYDVNGVRWKAVLRRMPSTAAATYHSPLTTDDVLLVTGGGKGIAAECALALARETGVKLALMGRSQPSADAELAANLERMASAGVLFRYYAADVTDAEAVRAAVREAEKELGAITALLHGAGANVPRLIESLDEEAFRKTLAPKAQGARNLLAAIDPERLRLFVTFGSIIARTGMRGEADYAVANEWLARRTEQWQAAHPHCRCLCLEWSVWSGVGMGERLGRVDALMQQGITPIPPEEGVRAFSDLLRRPPSSTSVVVAGRFGGPPTLRMEQPELPFLRFLERPRVYYPGVELVVDAELSGDTDLYLDDHVYRGERLLPAVMGLEAMAQAARALLGAEALPVFEDVRFDRPVAVPSGEKVTIRLAALVREPGRVEIVLRCSDTAFQVDHFRATCRVGGREDRRDGVMEPNTPALPHPHTPTLHPSDLYGDLLFHTGRFRRLGGYRRLRATECLAEITPNGTAEWFGRYLPGGLLLGDPAARDAAIHAIQACIPHATVLPVGADRLVPGLLSTKEPLLVEARERAREGDLFTYDLRVLDGAGQVVEQWEGLRLQVVDCRACRRSWPEPLLGPYIERRVEELIPGAEIAIFVERAPSSEHRTPNAGRRKRSDRAMQQALGESVPIWRRTDGKPEAEDGRAVSAAHAGDLTLAAAGCRPLACDIEPVAERPESLWQDLLGPERFALASLLAQQTDEDAATAATRVWTAMECLKKVGAAVDAPLTFASAAPDGWALLASGQRVIATCAASVREHAERLVMAVCVER